MAEPGYCITMEGADTTAENLMLDLRKNGKPFPEKALKRIGISLLHLHEHGIIHSDFGTHNIGKFGNRWKLLGVGGSVPLGRPTDPSRGFYHPPESIVVEQKRGAPMSKKSFSASVVSIPAHATYDIWAYGVVLYEALAGLPLGPYACRGKRAMSSTEVCKIGMWDESSMKKALKHIPPTNPGARDLLKKLLHPDPNQRISSMRHVLEHEFFGGGSEGYGRETSPTNNAFGSYTGDSRFEEEEGTSGQEQFMSMNASHQQHDPQNDAIKWAGSGESIENRENGRSGRGRSSLDSAKSGRSFGGFRQLARNTFRSNTNGSGSSNAGF
jgi:serine/threonine protein kinase